MLNASSVIASVFLRPALALLGLLLLGAPGGALTLAGPAGVAGESESATAAADLPAAEKILDRYVEVTGGKKAYGKIQNRVVHGTFELVNQGIKGNVTIFAARPNLLYSVIQTDAIGKIERGTDGRVAWERSDMTGPAIKSGQEKIDMLRDATFDRLVAWRDVYASAKNVGTETVEGEMCDRIRMTPAEGHPQDLYFERASGLLVRLDATVETQMGAITMESYLSDYQTTDEIRMPREVRIVAMGQERRLVNGKVEHNVEMTEDRFTLPADVQALLEQQSGAAGGR